jgi:hypothetical protein
LTIEVVDVAGLLARTLLERHLDRSPRGAPAFGVL